MLKEAPSFGVGQIIFKIFFDQCVFSDGESIIEIIVK